MENTSETLNMQEPEKMGGVGFYIMVGFALLKDILDGLAGITLILSILTIFTSIFIWIILWFYYFFSNVGFIDKFAARKVAAMLIPFILEMIPLLNIIPTTTISLFLVRSMENHERFRKFVHMLAGAENQGNLREMISPTAERFAISNRRLEEMLDETTLAREERA